MRARQFTNEVIQTLHDLGMLRDGIQPSVVEEFGNQLERLLRIEKLHLPKLFRTQNLSQQYPAE